MWGNANPLFQYPIFTLMQKSKLAAFNKDGRGNVGAFASALGKPEETKQSTWYKLYSICEEYRKEKNNH